MINYILKLYPTFKQTSLLESHLFFLTGVYNTSLKKLDSILDLNYSLTQKIYYLKSSQARYYLNMLFASNARKLTISSRAIQGMASQAVEAKTRFLEKQNRKTRLKSKRNKLSSFLFQGDCKFSKDRKHIILPKLGHIRFKGTVPEGELKQVRVMKKASGWHVCCSFDSLSKEIEAKDNLIVGIDPGFETALTVAEFSKDKEELTFKEIINPRLFEREEKNIGKKQRSGSKKKAARAHERLSNKRKDWQHKVSRTLVSSYQTICVSNDSFKNLQKKFGKSINSLGLSKLYSMLENKISRRSDGLGTFHKINSRNSTKTCSTCGKLNGPSGLAGLKIRYWRCETCGVFHSRDKNSAMNTLISGLDKTSENMATYVRNHYKTINSEMAVGNGHGTIAQ